MKYILQKYIFSSNSYLKLLIFNQGDVDELKIDKENNIDVNLKRKENEMINIMSIIENMKRKQELIEKSEDDKNKKTKIDTSSKGYLKKKNK